MKRIALLVVVLTVSVPLISTGTAHARPVPKEACKKAGTTALKIIRNLGDQVSASFALGKAIPKNDTVTTAEKRLEIQKFAETVVRLRPTYEAARDRCLAGVKPSPTPKSCAAWMLSLEEAIANLTRQTGLMNELVDLVGKPGTQPDIDARGTELGTLQFQAKELLRGMGRLLHNCAAGK